MNCNKCKREIEDGEGVTVGDGWCADCAWKEAMDVDRIMEEVAKVISESFDEPLDGDDTVNLARMFREKLDEINGNE